MFEDFLEGLGLFFRTILVIVLAVAGLGGIVLSVYLFIWGRVPAGLLALAVGIVSGAGAIAFFDG